LDAAYKQALCVLVGALGIKVVVVTLMTVRCRLVSGEVIPNKEDDNPVLKFLLNYVFKILLVVCPLGPSEYKPVLAATDPNLVAWLSIHRNAMEQEPFFMVMAIAYPLVAEPLAMAPYLLYTYLASRVLHMFCYALGLQPFRSLTFVAGLFATLGMGVIMLLSLSQNGDSKATE